MRLKSTQPRKQRLARYEAPPHVRRKFLSAPLSRELREKYGRRNLPVRKGDTVRILRGDFRDKEGKVTAVDVKRGVIFVDGVVVAKADLSEVPRPIPPSNVMITKLELKDKWRARILER
ncbi:50S ribosomal protein L24 [Candidatus Alkanophaga liquidiphilum]|nr:Ribosomal protein L24 [Candidatus Alkanophaga liquidiphilum]RLG38525.1 MAG: 50S ribosomal protein L24 [Candidatus Alkanophagales archaeon]